MSRSELVTRIQGEIQSNPVIVYSKSGCPFCVQAKRSLDGIGVRYLAVELDRISEGGAVQKALAELTRQRTVPNIFIGGEHVGGCSELQAGIRNGKVPQLFQKHGIQCS